VSPPKRIAGPWVVLAVFAIVAVAAAGILLFALNSDPPPAQPAPPEASLVPRVVDLPDAAPTQP
jgi:hypothetical protein